MLNQTINVKIKYENIIKKLIENDRSRDYVLSVIENMQQPASSTIYSECSQPIPLHLSQNSTPSLR